jgi:CHASE3 domain sensor protein
LKLTVGQRILFGYGLAMLFMALTGIAGYRGTERLLLANYWVRHTYSVISEAKGIHAALLQFESSRRGYLITGDASYLEPSAGLLRRLADTCDSASWTLGSGSAPTKRK